MAYTLERPTRKVFYIAVGRDTKCKTKAVVESVVYRGGDALAGWLSAGPAALGIGFAGLALAVLPLTALWPALGVWPGRQNERLARRTGDTDADAPSRGLHLVASGALQ